ncbi:MAG: SRPBCC family protein [Solirubrobacterales bacterium]
MIHHTAEVTIDRPPEQVFPYLVEPAKQALWSDVPMRPLNDGPYDVGKRMELTFGRGPIKATLTVEIAALETDRRFAWITVSKGGIQWDGAYRLEPAGPSGSKLSQAGTLRFTGVWRLLESMIGSEIRKGEAAELVKLKTVVEAGG